MTVREVSPAGTVPRTPRGLDWAGQLVSAWGLTETFLEPSPPKPETLNPEPEQQHIKNVNVLLD